MWKMVMALVQRLHLGNGGTTAAALLDSSVIHGFDGQPQKRSKVGKRNHASSTPPKTLTALQGL